MFHCASHEFAYEVELQLHLFLASLLDLRECSVRCDDRLATA